ncbi:MAG TPA: InlB B-repeat-containing protein [Methanocorpusculum sp.]|nr:InlB B-repeat-containing protein [Methanocorpusculum sp.]
MKKINMNTKKILGVIAVLMVLTVVCVGAAGAAKVTEISIDKDYTLYTGANYVDSEVLSIHVMTDTAPEATNSFKVSLMYLGHTFMAKDTSQGKAEVEVESTDGTNYVLKVAYSALCNYGTANASEVIVRVDNMVTYQVEVRSTNKVTIAEGEPPVGGVARIGNQGYDTLQGAINAVADGETIILQEDVELTSYIHLDKAGTYVIDGGNHKVVQSAKYADANPCDVFKFGDSGNSITTENCNITLKDITIKGFGQYVGSGQTEIGGEGVKSWGNGIVQCLNCTMTLQNVTFENNKNYYSGGSPGSVIKSAGCLLTVDGCTFKSNSTDQDFLQLDCESSGNTAHSVIKNTVFDGNNFTGACLLNICGTEGNTQTVGSAVTVQNCKFKGNNGGSNSSCQAIIYENKAAATIKDCTFDGNTLTSTGSKLTLIRAKGTVTITDNLFTGNTLTFNPSSTYPASSAMILDKENIAVTNDVVTGNVFMDNNHVSGDDASKLKGGDVSIYVKGVTADLSGNYWGTGSDNGRTLWIKKGFDVYNDGGAVTASTYCGSWSQKTAEDEKYGVTVTDEVSDAKIGDTPYANLADAIDAVPADNTVATPYEIDILRDITLNDSSERFTVNAGGVTIDGNGHTIGVTKNYQMYSQNLGDGLVTLYGDDDVLKNVVLSDGGYGRTYVLSNSSCKRVVYDNVEFNAVWFGYRYGYLSESATFNNCRINVGGNSIHFDGANTVHDVLTVSNCSIKGIVALPGTLESTIITNCDFSALGNESYWHMAGIASYGANMVITNCNFDSVCYCGSGNSGVLFSGYPGIIEFDNCAVVESFDPLIVDNSYTITDIVSGNGTDCVYMFDVETVDVDSQKKCIGGVLLGGTKDVLKNHVAPGYMLKEIRTGVEGRPNQYEVVSGYKAIAAEYSYDGTVSTPALSTEGGCVAGGSTSNPTYFYSTSANGKGSPWNDLAGKTLNAGSYYVYATYDIGGKAGVESQRSTFSVAKADQNEPGITVDAYDGYISVTVGDSSTVKNYEYAYNVGSSLASSPTWIPVNGNTFEITGLKASTTYTVGVKAKESVNYNASSASTTTVTTKSVFSVTYNANGGIGGTTQNSVNGKVNLKSTSIVSREGYTVSEKWYTAAEGGTEVSSPVEEGMTVYAHWTGNEYTITFNNDGTVTTQKLNYGSEATALTAVTQKDNYSFAGWATTQNGTVVYADKQEVQDLGDITLYAVWVESEKTYAIKANVANSSGTVKIKLMKGSATIMDYVDYTDAETNLFSGITSGLYNLVAVDNGGNGKTVTVSFELTEAKTVDVTFPASAVNSKVEVKTANNTPAVVVGELDKEAEAKAETGSTVTITLTVEAKVEAEVAESAKSEEKNVQVAIEAIKVEDAVTQQSDVIEYLEVTVTKKVNETNPVTLAETSNVIELVIPFDMTNKTNIVVYRNHDGKVEQLEELKTKPTGAYDDGKYFVGEGLIYVYAQKFSTYAVGYKDSTKPVASSSGSTVTSFIGDYSGNNTFDFSRATVVTAIQLVEGSDITKSVRYTPTSAKSGAWYAFTVDAAGYAANSNGLGHIWFQIPLDVLETKNVTEMQAVLDQANVTYFLNKDNRYAYYEADITSVDGTFTISFDGTAQVKKTEESPVVSEEPVVTPVEPVTPVTPVAQAATPMPIFGILAGLGAVCVLLKTRRD